MKTIIKNIRAIFPNQNIDETLSIFIENGIIQEISKGDLDYTVDKVIEGKELILSPGLIDIHVHFRTPGQTHKEDIDSGANAAANGGFTAVVCMPNTSPAIDNLLVYNYLREASKNKQCDIYYSAAITKERKGLELTDMISLADAGVLFFTDDGDPVESPGMMLNALQYAATGDYMLSQHCEEKSLTKGFAIDECESSEKYGLKGYPKVAEELIISRDIALSFHAGNRRYHVQHLSSAGSVEIIRNAKAKGSRVSCEVAPHHFSLTNSFANGLDSNLKMNPPLRSQSDIDAIIQGLKDDTIDLIATDHAPHSKDEKAQLFELTPNGITGLETSLGVTLTHLYHSGYLSLNKIIDKMSVCPRNLLKLDEIRLEKGQKANFTLFNPNSKWTVNLDNMKSKSQNSPYIGTELIGKPEYTILGNEIYKSIL